jgi:hypothetical protein
MNSVGAAEIYGGREDYQVSLERTRGGELLWHCTCPDAVYRGRDSSPHYCKHVRALTDLFGLVSGETGPAEPLPSTLVP